MAEEKSKFEIEIETNASAAAADMEKLGDSAGKTERREETLKKAIGDLVKALNEYAKSTDKVGAAQEKTGEKTAKTTEQIDKQRDSLRALGESLVSRFTNLAKTLTAAGAAMWAIGKAGVAIQGGLEQIDKIFATGKAADKAGMTITQMDALGRSIAEMGGNAEAVSEELGNLNDTRLAILAGRGKFAAEQMKNLGISMKDASGHAKKTGDLILELADKMGGMDKDTGTGILRQLGFNDPKMIALILQGREAVEKAIETDGKHFLMTEKQYLLAKDYKMAVKELNEIWTGFGNKIAEYILPLATAFTKGLIWLNSQVRDNMRVIIIAAGILTAFLVPAIMRVGAAALQAAARTAMMLAPYIAIAAAVGVLAAVFEDLYIWFKGGDSMIGRLCERFPQLNAAMEVVRPAVELLINSVKILGMAFKRLFSGDFKGFAALAGKAIMSIAAAFGDMFAAAWPAVKRGLAALGTAFMGFFKWLGEAIMSIMPNWARWGIEKITGKKFEAAPSAPMTQEEYEATEKDKEIRKNIQKKQAEQAAIEAQNSGKNEFIDGAGRDTRELAANGNGQIKGAQSAALPISGQNTQNTQNVNVGAPQINVVINATDTAQGAAQAAAQIGEALKPHIKAAAQGADNGTRG